MGVEFAFIDNGDVNRVVCDDIHTSVECIFLFVAISYVVQTANSDVVLVTAVAAHFKVIVSITTHIDVEIGRVGQSLMRGVDTFQYNGRCILIGNGTFPALGNRLVVRIDTRGVLGFLGRFLYILVSIIAESLSCLLVVQNTSFICLLYTSDAADD